MFHRLGAWVGISSAVFLGAGCSDRPPPESVPASPGESAAASAAATPATASPPASSAVPPARRQYRVAAIGDSLTDSRAQGGKYLSWLETRCPESRFENFGKGGDMANMMRRRFEARVLPRAKDELTDIIVFGGVNDLYSDLTAHRTHEKITGDLGAMYAAARARGWRVIALTVAPWAGLKSYFNERRSQATLKLNDWIRARVEAGDVNVVVDTYPMLSCGEPELLCAKLALPDGVHMNEAGHAVLGEALWEAAFSDCR